MEGSKEAGQVKGARVTVGRAARLIPLREDGLRTRDFDAVVVVVHPGLWLRLRLRVRLRARRWEGARRGGVEGAGWDLVDGGGAWTSKMCIWRVRRVATVESQIWSWISAGRRANCGKLVATEEAIF